MPISIGQQIEEVERELAARQTVYERMYVKGTLKRAEGEYFIERMGAVLKTLQWIRQNELRIKKAMTGEAQPKKEPWQDGASKPKEGTYASIEGPPQISTGEPRRGPEDTADE